MNVDYKRIDFDNIDDITLLKDFYENIYIKAFGDEDERETLENILKQAGRFKIYKDKDQSDYYFLLAVLCGRAVGGMIADAFPGVESCALEFIAVKDEYRNEGIGDGLMRFFHDSLKADCPAVNFTYMFFEVEDPLQMPAAQFGFCMKRTAHWAKRGAKKVSIDYLQPALSENKNDVDRLFLCCFAGSDTVYIETKQLYQFLYVFFVYAFDMPEVTARARINKMLRHQRGTEKIMLESIAGYINNESGMVVKNVGNGYFEMAVSKANPVSTHIFGVFYETIFVEAFPDENERGSLAEFLHYFNDERFCNAPGWYVDLIIDEYNNPVAGVVYSCFFEIKAVSVQFIVVDKRCRGKNLATQIIGNLKNKAAEKCGFAAEWLFIEVGQDQLTEKKSEARRFWSKCGMKIVDYDYVQPALSGRLSVEALDLCVKNYNDDDLEYIDTTIVKHFVSEYSRKAIMIDNPENDEGVLENMRRLDSVGARIKLKKM